jgi:DNA mismatch repair protein MutS
MIERFWTQDIESAWLASTKGLKNIQEDIEYISRMTDHPKNFGLFNWTFGHQLERYKHVDKDILSSIVRKTYLIDVLLSCQKFKTQFDLSFVEFTEESKVDMKRLRHPCLDSSKVITNDFVLGNKNVIITGPNAGGKSTFIKAIMINALLCQTIGIATCSSCVMKPFSIIHSQINIPDAKGYESSFEAEMHRCLNHLNLLKNHSDKHTLVIMDEIFNSTNPIEGISAAYAIAKKIADQSSCKLVFTTHYGYLTKLAKGTNRFVNYRMNVAKDDEGNMIFPYKINRGISRQYIALELLKNNGFDADIIEEALTIKNRLCV